MDRGARIPSATAGLSVSTAAQYADTVEDAWAAFLTRSARSQQTPHEHVYASAWRACERRMVYELTAPEQLPPWPVETLARFRRGDDRERDLLADLVRAGRNADPPFKVVNQQERFALRDRKGRTAIVGKVDARLEFPDMRAPLEVKAWSPYVVDRIETFADLFENPWTRSGGYQLLAYLYGAAVPYGFLVLDRSGLPKLLPVELDAHLDRVEAFLTRAERVLDHRDAGTLPEFIDDAAECQRCPWFGGVCNPPTAVAGAQVLTDPELEAALERREALKAAAKEYDALDTDVKKHLRGVEKGIVGAFAITGKWGKSTRLVVPDDVRAKYTETNPKGRFTVEITRL